MGLDYGALELLMNPPVWSIFNQVASKRKICFGDLLGSAKEEHESIDRESAKKWLYQLKEADLIGEKPSTIEDFTTYFITAKGLEAIRKSRRFRE